MISQTAEYALRAVVWLASHPDALVGTSNMARATHVPAGYMSKVLQALARYGLVVSQPGRKGGFRLARPAEVLTVLEVINAVEPIQRIRTCPLQLESHGTNLCPLHRKLDSAMAEVERAFADSTIADLLRDQSGSPPLCEADDTNVRSGEPVGPSRTVTPRITR